VDALSVYAADLKEMPHINNPPDFSWTVGDVDGVAAKNADDRRGGQRPDSKRHRSAHQVEFPLQGYL